MAKSAKIPLPQDSVFRWVSENPDAVRRAVEMLNLLADVQLQLITPPQWTEAPKALLVSPNNAVLTLPLKFPTAIANATDAASVITQLNLLLAALRQTGQLPT